MLVPVINIALGAGLMIGGATGRLALIGTSSTTASVVLGVLILAFGIYQLVTERRARTRPLA